MTRPSNAILRQVCANHPGLHWLEHGTIYLVRHGSHAYGTSTPESDLDVKGVAVPPTEYFYGFNKRFEQAEAKDPDAVIYDVRKFFNLAADCNPNIIEVLFCDEEDVLGASPQGEYLRENRDLFLSRKAKHTFSGYAAAQLKRIRGHHRWLKDPPKDEPTRADFGLPERTLIPADQLAAARAAVQKKIDSWQMDLSFLDPATRQAIEVEVHRVLDERELHSTGTWSAAARAVGLDDNFIELMDLERRYEAARRQWAQYQEWKRTRNPKRAELEARHFYDTKHACHLVRLLRMCREILEGRGVIVRRPDREELLAIRDGAWEYERLVEWAEAEDRALDEVAMASPLPWGPDRERLDRICCDIVE
jgi:predicted nucleotidyltransferase